MTYKEKVHQWCELSNELIGSEYYSVVEPYTHHDSKEDGALTKNVVLINGACPVVITTGETYEDCYAKLLTKYVATQNPFNGVFVGRPAVRKNTSYWVKFKFRLKRFFGLPLYQIEE